MHSLTCRVCGEAFSSKRAHALYCGAVCRKRASRGSISKAKPETGAAAPASELVQLVRAELDKVDALETVPGQQALVVADRMSRGAESGSAVASLSQELTRLVVAATRGRDSADPVDEVKERRDRKEAEARKAAD